MGLAQARRSSATVLSLRERQVLQLIAEGYSNVEVGKRLILSEETIKTHVRHILHKLEAKNRAHAVATGIRRREIV